MYACTNMCVHVLAMCRSLGTSVPRPTLVLLPPPGHCTRHWDLTVGSWMPKEFPWGVPLSVLGRPTGECQPRDLFCPRALEGALGPETLETQRERSQWLELLSLEVGVCPGHCRDPQVLRGRASVPSGWAGTTTRCQKKSCLEPCVHPWVWACVDGHALPVFMSGHMWCM